MDVSNPDSAGAAPKHAEYWRRFEDQTPGKWLAEETARGWTVEFPNGQTAQLPDGRYLSKWQGDFPKDSNSTRLWHNSLRYLPVMLEQGSPESVNAVEVILRDFRRFLEDALPNPEPLRAGSLDHQCALQLRTVSEIIAWVHRRGDQGNRLQLRRIAEDCRAVKSAIFALADKLDLLQPHNHGIMLAIAMIHADFQLAEDAKMRGRQTAEAFLDRALDVIIDGHGVVNENSPVYQGLYVNLLRDLGDFYDWAELTPPKSIQEKVGATEQAYRHMLMPDGSVPPLGDGSRSSQSALKPLLGTFASTSSGLYIRSNPRSFVSFICGHRGVIHKQMDDNSIFVAYDGNVLLADGGLASYDMTDPIARSVRSQRGHSGFFLAEYDHLDPQKIINYREAKRRLQGSLEVLDRSGEDAVCGRIDTGQARMTRELRWKGDRSFFIRDSIETKAAVRPLTRFLFFPGATVEVAGTTTTIVNGAAWMTIRSDASPARRFHGHEGTQDGDVYTQSPKGFVAVANYKVRPAEMIEFDIELVNGVGVMQFEIEFGGER